MAIPMIRNLTLALGLTLTLTACASANKRFEQGAQLQAAGRPAEAAERYIQALKKDSRLDSARTGLRSAGAAAIELYLQTAASPATPPHDAAEQFIAIDDLSKRALEVGIFLVPANDYEARKRAAFDNAIRTDVFDARSLTARREFAVALNRLTRASNMYQPSATQAAAIGNAGAEVAIAWGRDDTTNGQFRSAYSRVEPIVNAPVSAAMASDARALLTAALARGSKRVAMVPVSATTNGRRALPDDALPALGDALLSDPWASPPRFVNMLSPADLDRDLRRLGLARRTLTSTEASRVARVTGADYVVVSEIDSTRREELNVRVTRRPVRTRAGRDTAYVVEEGTARLFAVTTFLVFDRHGQRLSGFQSVDASASAPFTRVRYAGDWNTLDLRLGERDLFLRGGDDRELVRSFVGAMSPRLGQAVFAEVVRLIP